MKTVVEADNTALSTRIAALILLLDGTPVSKISELTLDDVDTTPTRTTIKLGDLPDQYPKPSSPLFHQHLADRNHRTMNRHCPWLFPGTRAGQHIPNNHSCIAAAFRAARNAALHDLTKEIDPASLADPLGLLDQGYEYSRRSGSGADGHLPPTPACRRGVRGHPLR